MGRQLSPPRYLLSHLVHPWHNLLVPTPGRVELAHRGGSPRRTLAAPLWQALGELAARPCDEAALVAGLLARGVATAEVAAREVRELIELRYLVEPLHDFWSDHVGDLAGAAAAAAPELARDRLRWSRDVIDPHGLWMYPRWLGLPVLQTPEDLVLLQMLMAELRPRFVIETGRFRGGGALFLASMCELLGVGQVISLELRGDPAVRAALEAHALGRRITLLDGDSAAPELVARVAELVGGSGPHLVILDSDHARAHVRAELAAYAPLCSGTGKLVVCDTSMSLCARFADDNPHQAVRDFLSAQPEWRISPWAAAGFVTCAEDGILERLPPAAEEGR